ncbi:exonuclease SbcCD subunit D [Paenibacillus sp. y28]|uniref:exonuclease SbcCD subunit D n=1 Tax=Paenibacillus sp. y28 TaxID=3129110 RepID=UPI003017B665
MRVLHTADWHLGRTLEGRSRLAEQEAFVDELVELVQAEQIDVVLIAGDAYDSVNPPAAAEQLFYEALGRLADGGRRQVAVIAGNHDSPERLSASGPLAARQGITLVGLPRPELLRLQVERTGEIARVLALPYPSESRLREVLSDSLDETVLRAAYSDRVAHLLRQQAQGFQKDTVNIMMSHVYVLGGAESDSERPIQVGGAYTVATDAFCVGAQYTALGHLHRAQTLKADELVRYSGSPLAYSFSEAGQAKSVTVFDASPGQPVTPRELYLQCGRPLVEWRAKEGLQQVHRWLEEGRDAGAWIDLELRLSEALSMEEIQRLRKAHDGIVNIRPVYADALPSERDVIRVSELSAPELFRRFYERQTGGAQPEPELIRLFMELLDEAAGSAEAMPDWARKGDGEAL